MKVCSKCNTHNLSTAQTCHNCHVSLSSSDSIHTSLKTAVLLGLMTSCTPISVGEPEYGVPVVDEDGDGVESYFDCDDSDPNILEGVRYHADLDGDGFGDAYDYVSICPGEAIPEDRIENDEDCNDNDANIHPDAEEIAGDGIDSNCNEEDDS